MAASLWLLAGVADAAAADDAHAALAGLALARGEWPLAAREYLAAAQASPDAALAERATRVAYDNDQYAAAAAAAARWLELAPGQELPRRYLATALLRNWRVDAALQQFRALLAEAYADKARGYGALLDILLDERDEVAAAQVIEQLAAGDPGLAEAQYARSVLWQRAGHGERALAAARAALQLRPEWTQAQLAEVRALLLLDRTDEGLARARALAEAGESLAQLNYAWFLLGAERLADARSVLERLLAERGNLPEVLEALGVIDYDQGNYDAAFGRFSEMLRTARGADAGFWYVGLIAEKQGDKPLAVRSLARVTGGSRAIGAQLRASRLLAETGAVTAAAVLPQEYLDAYPAQGAALVGGLATLHAGQGRGAQALALLGRARQLYPDDVALAVTESVVLERLDRVDEGVRLLRQWLARRPGDPTLLNSLGYLLVDRTDRLAEGAACIREALAQQPDNFAIVDSMGWALRRQGRPAEALPYLERAWRRSRDAEVAWHLGETYLALGRRDDARALLAAAAGESPDDPHVALLRERLGP